MVDTAGLENRYTVYGIEGSNPSASAKKHISKNQGWKSRRFAPRLFLTISQKVKIGGVF